MSVFEITERQTRSIPCVSVKRLDEKWRHFPGSTLLPLHAEKLDFFRNFPVRSDDIFILGFPRSGTSRLQELVWIIANDFDFETLLEYDADTRVVSLEIPEWSFKWREKLLAKSFEEMPSPRLMKCHLPVQLLPDEIWTKKPKFFYISRNLKDVVISMYHFEVAFSSDPIKLEDFLEYFMADNIIHTPYRENTWNYLNLPDYENILYLTYEEMSADMDGAIHKIADFLGKTVSDENAEKIKDYLKFENMKKRKTNDNRYTHQSFMQSATPTDKKDFEFIRKGVVGGYKDELPEEYAERIDKWLAESGSLNQGYNYKDDTVG